MERDRATGHPLGVPRTLDLPSGERLLVRHVQPADADALRSFYEELDDDATFRRFFTPVLPPPDFFDHLASIADRDGCSLVVVDVASRTIVAEADYELLQNGNGEMAMTVSHLWRGWMGPFLLEVLCQVADANGVPNFEAEILSTNRPMRAITRARGEALLPVSSWQTVRVVFSTHDAAPRFTESGRPKVLVESRSSAFRAIHELSLGGYDVMACHGRANSVPCPLDCGQVCPLAESADLVILAGPDGPDRDRVADAHRRLHPTTMVTALPRVPGQPIDGRDLLDAARQHDGQSGPT